MRTASKDFDIVPTSDEGNLDCLANVLREDLIAMKRAAGRSQDPLDLSQLGAS